ncbi:MAG: hypothetical protein R3D25_07395 [Geminicoccaceae bacterium]
MSSYFFNDLLGTIVERGRSIIERGHGRVATDADLADLAEALVGGRGEASGVAVAATLLDDYAALDREARAGFFEILAEKFGAPAEPPRQRPGPFSSGRTTPMRCACTMRPSRVGRS